MWEEIWVWDLFINLFLQIKYFRKLGNASLFRRKSKDVGEQDVDTEASEKDSVFKIIFKQVNQQIYPDIFPANNNLQHKLVFIILKKKQKEFHWTFSGELWRSEEDQQQ